jgi:hypothetical protein
MNMRRNDVFSACCRSLLGLLVLTAGGCGSSTTEKPQGSATVTVTFGGQPVTEGLVSLQNTNGEGGGGPLNSLGVATLSGLVMGNYVVTITPPLPDVAPPEPGKTLAPPKAYAEIPVKFRRMDKSSLKAEVKAAKNEFKFDLKS